MWFESSGMTAAKKRTVYIRVYSDYSTLNCYKKGA